ncbi:MAG: hypothetical protein KA369_23935 [Spirochaetes bacterium]|nr:hypothetical protein [Spirochaetota bacterium]
MKRTVRICAAAMAAVIAASAAYAGPISARIGISGQVWYSWWQPPWKNGDRLTVPQADILASFPYRIKGYETSPAPLFGFGVFAEILKTWYFSSSLMFGSYLSRSASAGPNPPYALSKLSFHREINKYDFDANIGYRVNRYFSVFLCVKTRAYDYTERINNAIVTAAESMVYKASARGEHVDVGPGLGVSVIVPMPKYENIFFQFHGSGMVLATSASYTNDYQYRMLNGALSLPVGQYEKESFYSWCGQGDLSLGYTLQSAGVTFMAGGRYEVTYYRHHRLIKGFLRYNGRYDHSYGMTVSIAYAVTLFGPDPVKMYE